MPTNKQRKAFKDFVQKNEIDINALTEDDAKEFVNTGTVERFKKVSTAPEDTGFTEDIVWPKEPKVVIEEPQEEIINTPQETWLTEDIVWTQEAKQDEVKQEPVVLDKQEEIVDKVIETKEDGVEALKKEEALDTFDNMIRSGATFQDVTDFIQANPQYRNDYISSFKTFQKQSRNLKFVSRFDNATQAEINQWLQSGNIIIGSNEFNSLSPQKQAEIKALNRQMNSVGRTDLSKFDSTLSFNEILEQVKEVFSSDVREKSEQLMNNEDLKDARNNMTDVKKKISKLDDKLENLEDDLKGSTISSITMRSKLREQRKSLIREKNLLIDEYNAELSTYKLIKDDINDQISIYKEEDAQNRQNYALALNLYQQNRAEMREDEKLLFQEQSKERASQRTLDNQKALAEFNAKLKEDNLSGGQYIDNGKWDLVYVRWGEQISVLKWLWKVQWQSDDTNYNYKTYQNDDGTYTVLGTPKKQGMSPFIQNFGINGDVWWDFVQNTGTWTVTSYGWEHDNFEWLDIDGNVWDPIPLPLSGKVIEVGKQKWYWNTAVVQLEDGNKIRFSHLNETFAQEWDFLSAWSMIGTIGNTGFVKDINGNIPTKEQLASGVWSHLDIVTISPDGKTRSGVETEKYLRSIGREEIWTTFVDQVDINTFNNTTFKPQNIKTREERTKYKQFLDEKNSIMRDKDADIIDVIRYSAGWWNITDTQAKSLVKFDQALSQVSAIQEQIKDTTTWPIVGRLAKLNPYNTDAQVLQASLYALIPNLARGVYWEVGVLTDNDIRNYARTIPNLQSTSQVNEAVLWMTLKVIAGGYKQQLQTLAGVWKDVSGLESTYKNMMARVNEIEDSLWIWEPEWIIGNYTTNNGYTLDWGQFNDLNTTPWTMEAYNTFFNQ